MTNKTVVAAAAAGSVLLLAVAGPSLKRKLFPSKNVVIPEDLEEIEGADNEDHITPEDVVQIFDQLFVQMQSVVAQLSQQIQQLQMAGQKIPEKQLRQILKQEFERALTARQVAVFDENDVDEDCIREATWEFLESPEEYPKVKRSVERFQKLYANLTGENVVGRRPGDGKLIKGPDGGSSGVLSQEKLIEAAQVYFDALTKAMGDIVKRMKAQGKNLRDPSVAQALQMEFASSANDAGEAALKELGVSVDTFRSSVDKHSQSPEVGRVLTMLQMKQQQELMAMGVPSM
uniref:Uncharacterized protein n=1 Tax=Odontella aurita TaxID=265563 RepID=A0A7S4K6Z1_9STRA|mmetsp:Transcript_63114/g.186488  ORF Transcript_63114/g.186488 Transcript_63114/m.186488 type:complete len:289 (+) Transcript_63114:232-1098(+)|eukprot:CAMPEP_0113583614 /NCGR_PEP_ID=MMETSP0015_2-20120614/32621_1 /TAXON_ID=2838 /ORGANISM="Odontella" /LENGTH=288 /DNA_ID=CAMNT_0000488523 /DNA_START=153 /DNA_END=1019 /DNA_ORIENTATION=- /assembly_acc=CAM_ASM_000160